MGTYWGIPLIALAVVLQATIVPQIRILGGQPDLPFLLVLAWSINGRLEQNVVWSFVGGVAQDLLSAAPLGASALGLVFLVFAIDQIKQQVYRVGFLLIVGLVIFGTILQKVVFLIVIAVVGFTVAPVDTFTYVVLPTIAYNLIFIWPIYWLIRRIQRRRAQEQHIITS